TAFQRKAWEVVAAWVTPVQRRAQGSPETALCESSTACEHHVSSYSPTDVMSFPSRNIATTDVSRRRADELIFWLREYADSRINSRLIDERRSIPPYIILDFGNRGLLGLQVPEHYGGLALRHRDCLRVLEQLAAIDLTLATVVFLHNSNGIRPIQHFA